MCLISRKKYKLLLDTIAAMQTRNNRLSEENKQYGIDVVELTRENARLVGQLKQGADKDKEITTLNELNRGLASSLSEAKNKNKQLARELGELKANIKLMRRKQDKEGKI